MITQLRELGYLVTVVSNTTHDEVDSWTSCQLGGLIDDPIFSFEVGSMKPEPAIYLEALRRLGCVASEAVFVGDGSSSELAGARRVGLQPIWATWFLERWPSWRMSEVEPAAATLQAVPGRSKRLGFDSLKRCEGIDLGTSSQLESTSEERSDCVAYPVNIRSQSCRVYLIRQLSPLIRRLTRYIAGFWNGFENYFHLYNTR